MKFKDIIIWLVIFIIGSLVVTFILYPNSFYDLKSRIVNSIKSPITQKDLVVLVPSEMQEYGFFKQVYKGCASIETIGEQSGVYDLKNKICREACGKRKMGYYSYECEYDTLKCNCEFIENVSLTEPEIKSSSYFSPPNINVGVS